MDIITALQVSDQKNLIFAGLLMERLLLGISNHEKKFSIKSHKFLSSKFPNVRRYYRNVKEGGIETLQQHFKKYRK